MIKAITHTVGIVSYDDNEVIERLQAENERLQAENDRLLHALWREYREKCEYRRKLRHIRHGFKDLETFVGSYRQLIVKVSGLIEDVSKDA